MSQGVKADVPMDIDVATGSLDGCVARVLTSSTFAKALLPQRRVRDVVA